ncbi:MAG: PTS mannitol transporter subunit IICBA [Eubacteriales bacterium]|nr:PTS mannitol transporter subunit IICBA [Eubacteriales bacterium]
MKQKVQAFGKFLSGMVMPNIGALIAFGLLAALFISTGWVPNEPLSQLNGPILNYLIPILIASTGGYMVGGERGRVMGAIGVVGAIVGCTAGNLSFFGVEIENSQTMLLGAMVIGPLGGLIIKKFDQAVDGKIPAGFEMLVNNFSVGILGMLLNIVGFIVVGPVLSAVMNVLSAGAQLLVNAGLLPLVAIVLEPAKVLFLNNAMNHGVFTPLGTAQAAEMGKSIFYMLETNPGPGLGVLIAYWVFCKDKMTRDSAPGAIIIHFFGGIHEIYFPYVLMNPIVIIAPILGNMAAIFFFSLTNCGLVSPASPGSILALLMVSPPSQIILTIIGVAIAAGVSFVVASPIIKMSNGKGGLEDAQAEMAAKKAESKGLAVPTGAAAKDPSEVKKVVFSCDAGMGSSAMGATRFRNRVKGERPDMTVINTSVDNIPGDADIVVCQTILAERAAKSAPQARLVTIGNFLADPALDALYTELTTVGKGGTTTAVAEPEVEEAKEEETAGKTRMLPEGIKLGLPSVSKEEAIRAAGELLKELGCVGDAYIDAMQEREKLVSTYMGLGVAIPHGTSQAKGEVKKSGIVFLQYPDGVSFGEEKAQLVFGIAGVGDEHLDLLSSISNALEDEDLLETLKTTTDTDLILKKFG